MVFFHAVHALFNLDFGFFIDVFMNNLAWVAIFYLLIHYFFDGKKVLFWFIVWSVELWIILDWETLTGYVFTGSTFLLLFYITKIILLSLAENSASLKKYMILLSALHAYALIFLFTFFLKGG